jgi:hypothetical protein
MSENGGIRRWGDEDGEGDGVKSKTNLAENTEINCTHRFEVSRVAMYLYICVYYTHGTKLSPLRTHHPRTYCYYRSCYCFC